MDRVRPTPAQPVRPYANSFCSSFFLILPLALRGSVSRASLLASENPSH